MILEPCISSGEKSASAVICTRSARLCAIDLLPPATGTATLKIYDNPSAASGTIVCEVTVASGTSSASVNLSVCRQAMTGLYASLTGTTTFVIGYQLS